MGPGMIYIDANVIIRLLEAEPESRMSLKNRLREAGRFLTCELSLLECRCRPLRSGDRKLLALYDALFSSPEIQLCPLDRSILNKATEIRAMTRLRTPDALHLASAVIHRATHFYTGDLHFKGIALLPVEII